MGSRTGDPPKAAVHGTGMPVAEQVLRLLDLGDYIVPLALRAVCELRVADLLAQGPRDVGDLAGAAGCDAGALRRFLRALAAKGIFTEPSPGSFALTPLGELLRSDHPLSLGDAFPLLPADLAAWARADHTLRTGESAFERVHGVRYYDYLAGDPGHSLRFDRSVETQNRLVLRALLRAYDWRALGSVVDVGGGNGSFLAGLLARHRHMRGTLIDLPHVVAAAGEVLRGRNVESRCEIAAGSFFDPLPAGADGYVLKTILHDWDDERATAILRNVRAAMRQESRLIVLEGLLPEDDSDHVGKVMALHSLVLAGGRDRRKEEFEGLFAAASLRLAGVTMTDTLAVLEAVPLTPA